LRRENSVQPVAVSSSTGERVVMMIAQVGCSSHPPQPNTPDGISNDRTIRRPFRTSPPHKNIALAIISAPL